MQELKKLFGEMMLSCGCGFEYERTVSQNWQADVTGQLKTTCATLENVVAFGVLLGQTSASKVFHHVLFGFVLLPHLPFHFSNSSSNFRTVSLFALPGFL